HRGGRPRAPRHADRGGRRTGPARPRTRRPGTPAPGGRPARPRAGPRRRRVRPGRRRRAGCADPLAVPVRADRPGDPGPHDRPAGGAAGARPLVRPVLPGRAAGRLAADRRIPELGADPARHGAERGLPALFARTGGEVLAGHRLHGCLGGRGHHRLRDARLLRRRAVPGHPRPHGRPGHRGRPHASPGPAGRAGHGPGLWTSSMSRFWTGVVDLIGQLLPLPLIVLIMLAVAAIIGLLWYFFPRWVPRRLPRFRKPRWNLKGLFRRGRWRFKWRWPDWRAWFKRRKRDEETDLEAAIAELEQSEEELPDAPL